MKRKKGIIYILVIIFLIIIGCIYMCEQKKVNEKSLNYDYEINTANYAQTECQFRYCGTAIPFLTVRSTAR